MLDRPAPPLNFIRSFEASARHMSFTAAAKELGYTQAAISLHIRSLEGYLGAPLFHRHPRHIALTETGEAFLPTLREALHLIDQATETVVVGNQRKTVTISCPMSLAENWLAPRVAAFQTTNPDIQLVIHGSIWDASAEPSADLSISMQRDADAAPGAVRIMRERLSLLAAPEWADRVSTPSELENHPLIVVLGRQEYWAAFADAIGNDGFDMTAAIRTNATNIALEIAASGAGIAATPQKLAGPYVARGILVELFDLHPPSPWNYYLNESTSRFSAAASKARDWILGVDG